MLALIVGLGNPGVQYHDTRHNAGMFFLQALCDQQRLELKPCKRFHGMCTEWRHPHGKTILLQSNDYMNHSGIAVAAVQRFYRFPPSDILIAHDELDFPPNRIRLKYDGSPAGHNGLKDIITRIGTTAFWRLRIGIGRPTSGHAITPWVLSRPSPIDRIAINANISTALSVLPQMISGECRHAQQILHHQSI